MSDKLKRMYSYPVDCGYYTDTANMMVKPTLPNNEFSWTRLGYCNAMYYHSRKHNAIDDFDVVDKYWFISYGCELASIIVRKLESHTSIIVFVNNTYGIWSSSTTRQFNRFCRENEIPIDAAIVRKNIQECAKKKAIDNGWIEIDNDTTYIIRPNSWEYMEDRFAAYCPWYKVV